MAATHALATAAFALAAAAFAQPAAAHALAAAAFAQPPVAHALAAAAFAQPAAAFGLAAAAVTLAAPAVSLAATVPTTLALAAARVCRRCARCVRHRPELPCLFYVQNGIYRALHRALYLQTLVHWCDWSVACQFLLPAVMRRRGLQLRQVLSAVRRRQASSVDLGHFSVRSAVTYAPASPMQTLDVSPWEKNERGRIVE